MHMHIGRGCHVTYNRAVSKATMCAEESEAYKQLDVVGKQRYTEKLPDQPLGLTGDPRDS